MCLPTPSSFDPKNPATMITMSGNVVFSPSPAKEEAFKFISWLTEPEQMDKWSRSRNGQLPVLNSVARMDHHINNEFFRVSMEGADYAIGWPLYLAWDMFLPQCLAG